MYPQITAAERYTLGTLRRLGYTTAAIARILGRHRSTVWREVHRNATHHDGTYRPQLAHWYATSRRSRSRRNQRFSALDWVQVHARLRAQWSPEQVAGRMRLGHELRISHETIYRHIWADKRAGGSLHTHLRGARKTRRKRYGQYDSRGRLVKALLEEFRTAGVQRLAWDGSNARSQKVASGLYFFRIQAPEGQIIQRVAVVK